MDVEEWNRRVVTIKDFWENLLKDVSMTGLGTSLLDTVETDETLEPLFRYSNKEVQVRRRESETQHEKVARMVTDFHSTGYQIHGHALLHC